jgi:hypothetical protein
MTVWQGVRKLSDASATMLAELSTNASGNNGSFYMSTTNSGGGGVTIYVNKGSLSQSQAFTNIAAPVTYVLTGIGDISGDVATLRVNGAQVATSTTDQGTGNYGNYPAYFYARAGTSLYFNGNDYGSIARGAASTAAQIANGETYMAAKTGVTLLVETFDFITTDAGDQIVTDAGDSVISDTYFA